MIPIKAYKNLRSHIQVKNVCYGFLTFDESNYLSNATYMISPMEIFRAENLLIWTNDKTAEIKKIRFKHKLQTVEPFNCNIFPSYLKPEDFLKLFKKQITLKTENFSLVKKDFIGDEMDRYPSNVHFQFNTVIPGDQCLVEFTGTIQGLVFLGVTPILPEEV